MISLFIFLLIYTVLSLTVFATEYSQIGYEMGIFLAKNISRDYEIIRIGTSVSLLATDEYGFGGNQMRNSWDMFVNWVNRVRNGVIINNTRYYFSLEYIEDYSNEEYVTEAYQKMIDLDQNDFYFGPYSSKLTSTAVQATDPNQQLLIASYSVETSIYAGKNTTFGMLTPAELVERAPYRVFSELGAKNITCIRDLTYPGCANSTYSYELASTYGIELLGHYTVIPGSTYSAEIRAIIEELQRIKSETVYLCTYLSLCIEV